MKLTLLLVLLSMRVALADPHDDARVEFAAGQTADKQRDWQAAIEHYLRAYELAPHPFALFNIANDYEQLGQLREAARFYRRYIDDTNGTNGTKDANDRARVEKMIADLEHRPAKLEVQSEPVGARVVIDGKPAGVTPFTGAIPGGAHRIAVETAADRQTKDITVEFAEPVDISFTLQGADGTLVVTGTPAGAYVAVEGSRAGVVPLAITLPSGKHTVRVSADGYQPKEQVVVMQPNQPTTIEVALENAPPSPNEITIQYLLGGIGGIPLKGSATLYAGELGVRTAKAEFLVQIGKLDGATSVGLIYRYAFLTGRLSPYIGGGYEFVSGNSDGDTQTGLEAEAGLRLDVLRGPVTITALVCASFNFYSRDTSGTKTTEIAVPLLFGLETAFGTSK